MPRKVPVDTEGLAQLLAPGRSVASHAELQALGVPLSTITSRIGPTGPWQRLLPGVVAGHRGTPTRHERRLAALKYAGKGAILTGLDALTLHGVQLGDVLKDDRVHVAIPHASRRSAHGFALLTRGRSLPGPIARRGLPCATVARAILDLARRSEHLHVVREVIAAAVQQRHCTVEEVVAELDQVARQRTALARAVIAEVDAGIRSVAEAKLRDAFARYGVPPAAWNEPARRDDGSVVAIADALWQKWRAVVEVDSIRWHLSPEAFRKMQKRQRDLVTAGFRVLSISPRDVEDDPAGVCRAVMAFLHSCAVETGEVWDLPVPASRAGQSRVVPAPRTRS